MISLNLVLAGLKLGLKNRQVGEKWVSDDCSYLCKGLAKSMNRNKSTISRELSRNTGKRGYRHKQANRLADERHQKKNKA
ncbi:Mobile element protein, partial [uncultured Gammaproteobacteria bacterium]